MQQFICWLCGLLLAIFTVEALSTEEMHPLLELREKSLRSFECGKNWRDDYRKLHEDIRSDRRPMRYFIVAHNSQGASDRLTAMITGFYAAVLSDRAFFISAYQDVPRFQLVFDSPSINITLNESWHGLFSQDEESIPAQITTKLKYRDGLPLFDERGLAHNSSMEKLFGDSEIVLFDSNRGYSYRLVNDSVHGEKLRAAGLNPVYAFNCAFHFLFKPNKELLEASTSLTEPFKDKTTIKIGIHIQTGPALDLIGPNKGVNSSHYYENFFNCAAYLEQTRIQEEHPGKKVLWYLISDSLPLKQDAKKMFGDKLIANHVDRPERTANSEGSVSESIRLHFVELLTLSLCDYFIISHNSHVGRLAVWISEHGASLNNTYFEHRNYHLDRHQSICSHYSHSKILASHGSGI